MVKIFKFDIGEIVYLKHDNDQLRRMVTRIMILDKGLISYELSCRENCSWHYEFEISNEKDILNTL